MKGIYIKKLLIIAVPIMLSNAISQLQMMIDRMFLGQLGDPLLQSALGNVTSPLWTTMSFCTTLAMGSSILMSQSVGAGDRERVMRYASSLLKWYSLLPILLFFFWEFCCEYVFRLMGVSSDVMPMCLTYTRYFAPIFLILGIENAFMVVMQTSNNTKPMLIYAIVRAGLNILLDWMMIFGRCGMPKMGITGAAIATTIAEYIGGAFVLVIVLTNRSLPTKPPLQMVLKASWKPFLQSTKFGMNAALEDLGWNVGNLVLIRILNSIDQLAAGVYSIVFTVEVLIVVMIGAIGSGAMTISGEARGNNDVKEFKSVCQIAYVISAGISFVFLLICIAFPQQILALFTKNEGIITTSGIYLLLVCLNLYGKSGNIIIGNGIRGSGNTIWMLKTQIFGTFLVIGVAEFFVKVCHFGMVGVFFAVIVDEGTRALINLVKLRSIIKRWNEPQTKEHCSLIEESEGN